MSAATAQAHALERLDRATDELHAAAKAVLRLARSNERAAAAKAAAATPQGGTGDAGQGVELAILFRGGRPYLGPFALAPAPQLF